MPSLPGRRAAAPAPSSRAQGEGEGQDAARDLLGALLPMFSDGGSGSAAGGSGASGGGDIGGDGEGEGLSSEEREAWQRWLPTVEEDAHELEEMRLREPFSPAYKALGDF